MDRDEVAKVVIETTQIMADGYRENMTDKTSEHEDDVSRACATAVSNSGVFILRGLGFSMDEIKGLLEAWKGK